MRLLSLSALQKTLMEGSVSLNLFCCLASDTEDGNAVARVVQKKFGFQSFARLDGADLTPAQLVAELESGSLFTSQKMIYCYDFDQLTAESKKILLAYLRRPDPSTILCLSTLQGKKETAVASAVLAAKGIVIDLQVNSWEREGVFVQWTMGETERRGKAISSRAAQAVIEVTGLEKAAVTSELEKLVCYVGKRGKIEIEDVQAICASRPLKRLWHLSDAIFERRLEVALGVLKELLLQKEVTPQGVLAHLRLQMQEASSLCSLHHRHASEKEIMERFPKLKGKRLTNEIQRALRYGQEPLSNALLLIAKADLASKDQGGSFSLLLETLIIRLSSCH